MSMCLHFGNACSLVCTTEVGSGSGWLVDASVLASPCLCLGPTEKLLRVCFNCENLSPTLSLTANVTEFNMWPQSL